MTLSICQMSSRFYVPTLISSLSSATRATSSANSLVRLASSALVDRYIPCRRRDNPNAASFEPYSARPFLPLWTTIRSTFASRGYMTTNDFLPPPHLKALSETSVVVELGLQALQPVQRGLRDLSPQCLELLLHGSHLVHHLCQKRSQRYRRLGCESRNQKGFVCKSGFGSGQG